jgi:hypothetical protein
MSSATRRWASRPSCPLCLSFDAVTLGEMSDPPPDRREKLRHLEIARLRVRHEPRPSGPVVDEHSLHGELVEVDVQVEGRPETLDRRHGSATRVPGHAGALYIEVGGASQIRMAARAFDSSEPVGELVPEPSIRLPSQIGATYPRFVAELGLVAAILEEALRTVSRQAGRLRQRRAAAEAYEWFFDEDRKWPFAFQNVCDLLGLDAQALRGRVLGEVEERGR